jgi:hemoglobin
MFKRFNFPALLLLGALTSPLASCDKDDDDTATPVAAPTLYDKLGKVAGITAVVDQFITNVVVETGAPGSKLKRTFQPLLDDVGAGRTARLTLLKHNLIDQIGQTAGGPLVYKGQSMELAHKGMLITDDEFTALVTALSQACDTKNVAAADKATLLGALGGLKSSIVGK